MVAENCVFADDWTMVDGSVTSHKSTPQEEKASAKERNEGFESEREEDDRSVEWDVMGEMGQRRVRWKGMDGLKGE